MTFRRGAAAFVALFLSVSLYFLLPLHCPEPARRMAAIFAVAAFFWTFEVIPLFATALLVVLLETFSLTKAGGFFGIKDQPFTIFIESFANPVIILFLGGFILAATLHKYGVDRVVAAWLLKRFGNRPYPVLLGFMTATAFLSLWISKTASTALMLAMILPLVKILDPRDAFRKALVLAVPFAANIGGTASPIGTPPNGIVIGMLAERGFYVNFLSWMAAGLPLAFLLILITSFILYRFFPPRDSHLDFDLSQSKKWEGQTGAVITISLLIIVLWLSGPWHHIPESIVALLGSVVLAVSGLLTVADIKQIDWDILILMWGGLALGEGMRVSGLADWMVGLPLFAHQGILLITILCLLSVFLSTFMSNTAAVNLLAPLAISLPGENPVLLAVVVAMASSYDLPLPISTPPMTMAYATREIKVWDMLKPGIFFTLISNLLLIAGSKAILARFLQ